MPTKSQQARVCRLIAKWKPRLLLDQWAVCVGFASKDTPNPNNGDLMAATIDVRNTYTDAHMTIYPHFFRQSYQWQKTAIVHELSHIHTRAVNGKIEQDLWENLTEQIAKIAVKAYSTGKQKQKEYLL